MSVAPQTWNGIVSKLRQLTWVGRPICFVATKVPDPRPAEEECECVGASSRKSTRLVDPSVWRFHRLLIADAAANQDILSVYSFRRNVLSPAVADAFNGMIQMSRYLATPSVGSPIAHDAHRARLVFRAILNLPQPAAFTTFAGGFGGRHPCCRRSFFEGEA